ncbi:protein JASON-like [Abrus precatorius]|uniref:Protein JASON-like n=1 Tax=Abrus precatorius TaxID=3816 RepID=A0A8B8MJ09_ABRPR|nr:protein JASON-like [Abrus precatorius]
MLKRVLGFLLRFFFRSFTKAMGCFFACFRIRENRRIHTAQLISAPSRSTSVLISRNRLSPSLSEEEREDSAWNDSVGSQGDDQGLKDEAKFLKACGTLPGTPAEFRKASGKLKVSPSTDEDSDPSKFHSWLPNTSVEKLKLDVQPFGSPTTIKICQEWRNSTDCFEQTPSSCISNAQDSQDDSVDHMDQSWTGNLGIANRTERNAASPFLATDTQRKTKSVRFECDIDLASDGSSSDDWHMKKSRSPNNQSAYKSSPYPTPMKLFDEMQTPGTVCPTSLEELRYGKAQIRSQFVYPTYNPSEHVFRCKILEEKDLNLEEDSRELIDSVEQARNATPIPDTRLSEVSNENEDIHFSRKGWDGNGIPNSTNKYKEDQKVKWHATPFEVRLDKALFEENFISQRKFIGGKPVPFDAIEEGDTPSQQ